MNNDDSNSTGGDKSPGDGVGEFERMFDSEEHTPEDDESDSIEGGGDSQNAGSIESDGDHAMAGGFESPDDVENAERSEPEQDSGSEDGDGENEFENSIKEQSELFRGYNVDDPEDIIAAINEVEPEAARELKSVFNEKQRLESKTKSLADQVEDVKEEFRAYRLQKKKQIEALEETAAKDFIKDILPVRDNLERAIEHDDIEEVREGIKMIIDGFDESLRKEGVDIIYPDRGDKVNPQVHKVMSTVKTDDVKNGHVVECYRPGYRIEDLLIRPARVSASEG